MKTLSDKTEVADRGYYYLLDWNEYDEQRTIARLFNKPAINMLTRLEYALLFSIATQGDLTEITYLK